jgi:5-methylthioribose kinase
VFVRRLVGIAHVADFDSIEDVPTRAACEVRALGFGRQLLAGANGGTEVFESIDALVSAAAVAAAK